MPTANTSQLGLIRLGTAQLGVVEPNESGISGTAAFVAGVAVLAASGTIVNAYTGTAAFVASGAVMAASGSVGSGGTNNLLLLGVG